MIPPNEIVDITLFGCPIHKIKALQAAKTLDTIGGTVNLVVNNDSLKTVVDHLEKNAFQCSYVESDSLTSVITVKQHG